ncbi:MAG TPA: tRNA pseudouridine(13) synthase TruD [Candidatus Nanoarchaeia archaeon]|nr:tRNA pseudouridine(13) synthase TruD [Candidatus Nanoarchaeia archaeon]
MTVHSEYVLKHIPTDFVVKEVSTIKPSSEGKFIYFTLKKTDFTVNEALKRIAQELHIPLKNFSYAGIKDRRAITEQVCSAERVTKEQLAKIKIKDIELFFLGYGSEPVHTGDLEGNRFEITIRNMDKLTTFKAKFKNLFGEQRFSTQNIEIGRLLLQRRFKEAAELICEKDAQLSEVMHLSDSTKDVIGSLRRIPRKQLLFLIHAFQSHLWNKAAMKTKAKELPLVGFGTVVEDVATKAVLAEENITPRDFIIKELPEISAEGGTRKVWAEARELKVGKLEPDECFEGKKKVKVEFFLPKGCYATEFIRQSFC